MRYWINALKRFYKLTSRNISLRLPGGHGNQTCLQNIQIIPQLLPFMLPKEPQIFIKHSLLGSILAWEFLPLKLILDSIGFHGNIG